MFCRFNFLFIIVFCVLANSFFGSKLLAKEYAVVIHNSNFEKIDIKDIKTRFLLFEGMDVWSNGVAVVSYDIDDQEIMKVQQYFSKKFLNMELGEYNSYWAEQKSKGRVIKRIKLKSFIQIARFAKRDPGSIAYINVEDAKGMRVIGKFEVPD